ncbi:hypothetical protein [Vibrio pectenicida]|nr:hypothetical protein [Vibrio pectenicida]
MMKTRIATVCFFTCLAANVQAETPQVITDTSPEGVFSKFELEHQIRESMEQNGYTQHRCGVESIRQSAPVQQQIDIPHSQFQCFYSKPGLLPTDESELAYWHLNVLYSHDTGLYKSGNEYTDYYQVNVYTHKPAYLLDAGPHYYKQRARIQSQGMTIGECNLQQIYYFMKPQEATYLSHVATCPVYGSEGEVSGNIQIDINYTSANMGYSERQVTFNSL